MTSIETQRRAKLEKQLENSEAEAAFWEIAFRAAENEKKHLMETIVELEHLFEEVEQHLDEIINICNEQGDE